jgi:hypothetical protein
VVRSAAPTGAVGSSTTTSTIAAVTGIGAPAALAGPAPVLDAAVEVVDPAQLIGPTGEPLNAYDRTIATQRLQRDAEGTATVARDLLGWDWDGLTLLLGGDMLSGNIHEELARTNDGDGPIDSVDHWVDPMAAAMELLAEAFGKVHVVGVVGKVAEFVS